MWCSQGTHKHIPVLSGKKSNPLFLSLRNAFLRLTGETGSYSKAWSKIKNYLSLKRLDEAQDPRYCPTYKRLLIMPQMLYIYVLPIWWESCLKLLSLWYISISLMFYKPASSSLSAQWLFLQSCVGSLIKNPFHLLRHDNPHSQFKLTAAMF